MAGTLAFCWIVVKQEFEFIIWLICYGFASGMIVILPVIVLPYICPNLAVIGTRIGIVYSVGGIGFLISTPIALALNANTKSFLGSQLWIGACCFVATAFYIVAAVEVRKRRRLQ